LATHSPQMKICAMTAKVLGSRTGELRAEEHLLIGLPAEQPVPDCPNVHLGPPTGGRSTIDTTSIGAEVA
jgi:hypothetical protein